MGKIDFFDIRRRKAYEKNDLIVYILLFFAVIALLFVPLLLKNKSSDGFYVDYNGEKILSFEYSDRKLTETGSFPFEIAHDAVNGTITVFFNAEKSEYNVLAYDENNKSVKMSASTCSASHDCTFSPPVSDEGAIYCAPHRLKIYPLSGGFSQPTTG